MPDSNGDGVPDFLADRNGDGNEDLDEIPWISQNNNSLAILSPADGSTVGGVIQIIIGLRSGAAQVGGLDVYVDGGASDAPTTPITAPATSSGFIEVDTATLENGPHTFLLQRTDATPSSDGTYMVEQASPLITLYVDNNVRFPSWEYNADGYVNFNMEVPTSETSYTISFFNSAYPKADDPSVPGVETYSYQDSPADGVISCVETLDNLGMASDNTNIYAAVALSSSGPGGQPLVVAARRTDQLREWPTNSVGQWVPAFEDDGAEYVRDPLQAMNNAQTVADDLAYGPLDAAVTWLHGAQLNMGWLSAGPTSGAGNLCSVRPQNANGQFNSALEIWVPNAYSSRNRGSTQTFPLRTFGWGWEGNNDADYASDLGQFAGYIQQSSARNFYGRGHGPSASGTQRTQTFFGLTVDQLAIKKHRWRFAFLDGCRTAYTSRFLGCFGMQDDEWQSGIQLSQLAPYGNAPLTLSAYPTSGKKLRRPGLFLGWRTDTIVAVWYSPGTHAPGPAGCALHPYDALCNWHNCLLSYWLYGGYDFVTSAKLAMQAAFNQPSSGMPPPDPDNAVVMDPNTNAKIPFTPDNCLMIFGYGALGFNSYNSATIDWQQ